MAGAITLDLPDGPRGRATALGLGLVALLLLWFGLASPLLDWHAARAEALGRQQLLLTRMEALAESLPEWRRTAEQTAARGPARATLLEGTTDALAAASLQGQMQQLANRAGVSVRSLEILPAEARGAYRRIAIRVSADGQWPALLALLRAIQEATPRMLVDGLALRGPDMRVRTETPPLSAGFVVIGFRAEAPK